MQFDKISDQNAWNDVAACTNSVRNAEIEPALLEWLKKQGIDTNTAVFPCIGKFDENTYSGTVIAGSRRAFEYFVDLQAPEESHFEDVTTNLGPKDPKHAKSDPKDLITMALIFFDEENRINA